jgi:hypothetical protein
MWACPASHHAFSQLRLIYPSRIVPASRSFDPFQEGPLSRHALKLFIAILNVIVSTFIVVERSDQLTGNYVIPLHAVVSVVRSIAVTKSRTFRFPTTL